MRNKGYLWIAAAAILWGILGPLSKLAFAQGVLPMEVAFWRAVLSWVIFACHAAVSRKLSLAYRDVPLVVLFALTGITLFYGTYQIAVRDGGAALASVLLYTAPAWVALIARFTFKEALTKTKIIALGLTLIGVFCVAGGSGNIQLTGTALFYGLAAGFSYSLYYIFGKYFAHRYTAANLFFYLLPIGAVSLLPWVEFTPKNPTAWTALLIIALLSTYCAYYCYYTGMKYLEASLASITATLEPVVAAVVAFFWWGEIFGAGGYLGSAMILSAVILLVLGQDRH